MVGQEKDYNSSPDLLTNVKKNLNIQSEALTFII